MITVSEATTIIFEHLFKAPIESVPLPSCTGKILAEVITADRDFPAFHRVSMDGIAILHTEWERGRRSFFVRETQAAGEAQKTLSDPAQCMEVMTGAILPAGCNTVIRYEDVDMKNGEAHITLDTLHPWQSVHQKGIDARWGQVLLAPGQILAPSEIALLASVGKVQVKVFAFPRIAIVSTGDELVDVHETPAVYQTRRSNSHALEAAIRELGGVATRFHLKDERAAMEESLGRIIDQYDVLILSGGVSKGKFDFVPGVLESIGIQKRFHHVSQRPGKPFWFGCSPTGKVAFALPGNPVSTFMCFYRYVKPWILKSLGTAAHEESFAVLGADFSFPGALTYFLQVSVRNQDGRLLATPVPGGGSGDFANLKNVSGFLELPLERTDFKAGEVFPYISFRR